jgi:hypothetical protein
MPFKLDFAVSASAQLADLKSKEPRKHKKVLKCLGLLESNPRHPGLNSHRYEDYDEVHGQKIWESYVENEIPGAYRVFWHYGPDKGEITVVAITPHP